MRSPGPSMLRKRFLPSPSMPRNGVSHLPSTFHAITKVSGLAFIKGRATTYSDHPTYVTCSTEQRAALQTYQFEVALFIGLAVGPSKVSNQSRCARRRAEFGHIRCIVAVLKPNRRDKYQHTMMRKRIDWMGLGFGLRFLLDRLSNKTGCHCDSDGSVSTCDGHQSASAAGNTRIKLRPGVSARIKGWSNCVLKTA